MKKLLSLLSVLTISGTTVSTTIAVSSYKKQETKLENNNNNNNLQKLKRDKREINSFDDYLEFNNKYINKIKLDSKLDIKGKYYVIIDKNKNIYINVKYNAYILKNGETTVTKINGISNSIESMIFDNNDNVYFGTTENIYFLKNGETTASKIEGMPLSEKTSIIGVDNENNFYFSVRILKVSDLLNNRLRDEKIYFLKNDKILPIIIEGTKDFWKDFWIFSTFFIKNDLYISTSQGVFVLKYGETTATKIRTITGEDIIWQITSTLINSKNDLYFGSTKDGLYKLKYGEKVLEKIFETNHNLFLLSIDNDDNIYFEIIGELYKLKYCETAPQKIELKNNGKIEITSVDKNNNLYFKIYNNVYFLEQNTYVPKQINLDFSKIKSIIFDYDNNAYFNTINGVFFLEYGQTKPIKINKIIYASTIDKYYSVYFFTNEGIFILEKDYKKIIKKIELKNLKVQDCFIFDNQNNIYFIAVDMIDNSNNIYFLKKGNTIPIKILLIDNDISNITIDKKNNIYFYKKNTVFVLKQGETIATKIEGILNDIILNIAIDSKDNVYLRTAHDGLYKVEYNSLTAIKIDGISNNPLRGEGQGYISEYPIAIDSKDNIYFSSLNYFYVLKQGETTATKIEGIDEYKVGWTIFIDYKDNVYVGSYQNTSIHKIKNGETTATIVFESPHRRSSYLWAINKDNNNNIYFGTGHGASILKQGETTASKIEGIGIDEQIHSLAVDSKDNIYFGVYTNINEISVNHAYILKRNETKSIPIDGITDHYVKSIAVDSKDNIYFMTFNNVFVLKQGETTASKIDNINEDIKNIIIDKNNDIYFLTNNWIYFLQNKLNFQDIIKNTNLDKIENNDDEVILNNLNYLNRENNYFLNLNKIKIINKTSTSAIIEAIKGKYRGQVTVNYKIKNKNEISSINLNDLLQKAVYFDFIDKNFYSTDKIKEIKNINIDNLNFENVEVTRDKDLKREPEFKNVCFSEKEYINRFSNKKWINIPKCEYNQKIKFIFQIINGINKDGQNNKQNGWNLNMNDENKLGNFVDLKYGYTTTLINILSNEFDFTNLNKQEQEMEFVFNEPEDKIELDPNEKATFSYSVRENKYEANLNLKQKINGNITAIVITGDNEEKIFTLSIKEAMQILQKYSLLPDEISINEDNSITFNGKAIFSRISESKPKLDLKTVII